MRNTIVGGAVLLAAALAGCGAEDQLTSPVTAASAAMPVEAVTGSAHTFQPAVGGGFVRRRLTFTARRRVTAPSGRWRSGPAAIAAYDPCFAISRRVRVGVSSSRRSSDVSRHYMAVIRGTERAPDEDIGGLLISTPHPPATTTVGTYTTRA